MADLKVTQLDENTTVASTDLLYVVDDPGGSAASQKATVANVRKGANPMTTAGDVIYGGASGAETSLAIGTANQVLSVNSGATAPEWSSAIGCCVSRSSALELASGTPTAITWNNEVRDDGGCWTAGAATRLTAPVAGWYIITAFVWWEGRNDYGRRLYILANGTTTIGRTSVASTATHNDPANNVSAVYYLAATEYVEIMADQNSSIAIDIQTGAMAQMARIR